MEKRKTVKELSIGFDIFINEGGVGAALFFVLIELIVVNTRNLWYVFGTDSYVNIVWAFVGAVGYSLVTTVVIRKNVSLSLKYTFPLFDVFLVFLGMNIEVWGHLFENPLRFAVTIFFSLFTGAVLLALGLINYKERESEDEDLKVSLNDTLSELRKYKTKFNQRDADADHFKNMVKEKETEIGKVRTHYAGINVKLINASSELVELKHQHNSLIEEIQSNQSEIKRLSSIMKDYKRHYFMSEKSRILKKKEGNRTAKEIETLRHAESY